MKNATSRQPDVWRRVIYLCAGLFLLVAVYVFQRLNVASFLGNFPPNIIFVINRTTRLILNDLACFMIIVALFQERKYLKVAFLVFIVELLVILPMYFIVKLTLEGDSEISSPLLSQVHRLIVNPMLMLLLIAGFFYQRYLRR